jgi:hypothetical protein
VENLDGKVNQFYAFAREHPDPDRPGWTTYIRALERHLYVGGAAGAEAAAPATPPRREAPGIDTDP